MKNLGKRGHGNTESRRGRVVGRHLKKVGVGILQLSKHIKRQKLLMRETSLLRACSHGGGGPRVGEVPHLGEVINLFIQSLFFS